MAAMASAIGQRAPGVGDVEVLDHPAVDGDRRRGPRPRPPRRRRSPARDSSISSARRRPRRRWPARPGSGWTSVLPSKPISTPWRHSAAKPSASRDVVVDAVEDHLAGLAGAEHGRRQVRRAGWRGPGPAGARISLARSLVPITSTATRGWAAIARTSKIAVGVSTIAQIVVSGAAGGVERGGDLVEVVGASRPSGSRRPTARRRRRRRGRRRPTAWRGRCSGSSARGRRTRPT